VCFKYLKSLQYTEAVPDNQKDIRPTKYNFNNQRLLTPQHSCNKSRSLLRWKNVNSVTEHKCRCNRRLLSLQQKTLTAATEDSFVTATEDSRPTAATEDSFVTAPEDSFIAATEDSYRCNRTLFCRCNRRLLPLQQKTYRCNRTLFCRCNRRLFYRCNRRLLPLQQKTLLSLQQKTLLPLQQKSPTATTEESYRCRSVISKPSDAYGSHKKFPTFMHC